MAAVRAGMGNYTLSRGLAQSICHLKHIVVSVFAGMYTSYTQIHSVLSGILYKNNHHAFSLITILWKNDTCLILTHGITI